RRPKVAKVARRPRRLIVVIARRRPSARLEPPPLGLIAVGKLLRAARFIHRVPQRRHRARQPRHQRRGVLVTGGVTAPNVPRRQQHRPPPPPPPPTPPPPPPPAPRSLGSLARRTEGASTSLFAGKLPVSLTADAAPASWLRVTVALARDGALPSALR